MSKIFVRLLYSAASVFFTVIIAIEGVERECGLTPILPARALPTWLWVATMIAVLISLFAAITTREQP